MYIMISIVSFVSSIHCCEGPKSSNLSNNGPFFVECCHVTLFEKYSIALTRDSTQMV